MLCNQLLARSNSKHSIATMATAITALLHYVQAHTVQLCTNFCSVPPVQGRLRSQCPISKNTPTQPNLPCFFTTAQQLICINICRFDSRKGRRFAVGFDPSRLCHSQPVRVPSRSTPWRTRRPPPLRKPPFPSPVSNSSIPSPPALNPLLPTLCLHSTGPASYIGRPSLRSCEIDRTSPCLVQKVRMQMPGASIC